MEDALTYSAFESRFRDKKYIGSGGFAKVYKVFDFAKNHYVALKVADVRPEWKQFTLQREVELVNNLPEHRNIGRYDACYRFNTGIAGEIDFAILRFYEYGNLEQFLNKQKINDEDKKLIILGILNGLAFLHNNNIIHRDLKSQNILLHREDGVWTPKIIDFGLSRQMQGSSVTNNSSIGLSFAFAAPEQILNKKITKNVDLWAVGVIIFRIIAGQLPFKVDEDEGDSSAKYQLEISRKVLAGELPPIVHSLPEPYRSVIQRCLVVDPLQRVQNAEELIEMINGYSEDGSLTASNAGFDKNEEDLFGPDPLGKTEFTQFLNQSESFKDNEEKDPVSEVSQINMGNPTSVQHLGVVQAPDSSGLSSSAPGLTSKKGVKKTVFFIAGGFLVLILAAVMVYNFFFNDSEKKDGQQINFNRPAASSSRQIHIREAFEEFSGKLVIGQDREALESLQRILDSAVVYKEIPPLKYYLHKQWNKDPNLKALAAKFPEEWNVLAERIKLQLN